MFHIEGERVDQSWSYMMGLPHGMDAAELIARLESGGQMLRDPAAGCRDGEARDCDALE